MSLFYQYATLWMLDDLVVINQKNKSQTEQKWYRQTLNSWLPRRKRNELQECQKPQGNLMYSVSSSCTGVVVKSAFHTTACLWWEDPKLPDDCFSHDIRFSLYFPTLHKQQINQNRPSSMPFIWRLFGGLRQTSPNTYNTEGSFGQSGTKSPWNHRWRGNCTTLSSSSV